MTPTSGKLRWKIQKSRPFLDAIFLPQAPAFVRQAWPTLDGTGSATVFAFHDVAPESFERQCRYLSENGYRALGADELLGGPSRHSARAVALTFDDGLKSLWTVAFPILKKYRLKAISFLIPGCMTDDGSKPPRPTLADVWEGRATLPEVTRQECGPEALVRWSEVRHMHKTGVVEFESHSLHHQLVPVGPRIVDFVHPGYDRHFFSNIHVPVYREGRRDAFEREGPLGLPIYESAPRLAAARRYFDDERVRRVCVDLVRGAGSDFFVRPGWRRELHQAARSVARPRSSARFETPEERDSAVIGELAESRRLIEEQLPGRRVRHLCLPWYSYAPFTMHAARLAGFEAVHFGLHAPAGEDGVRVIKRVDQVFVRRLPGGGRQPLHELFLQFGRRSF